MFRVVTNRSKKPFTPILGADAYLRAATLVLCASNYLSPRMKLDFQLNADPVLHDDRGHLEFGE
jgi:hypothetical protein